MASREAAKDRLLRQEPERGWAAWDDIETNVAAEGVQGAVSYRGAVREVLWELLSGLRSGMSYCNASSVAEMWRNARFVRQTPAGIREGGIHGVSML
jgi:IMP dehydrogenase